MQIRLTVVDPLGPPSDPRGRATARDVLVTAPAGTALAAVAAALSSAVSGEAGGSAHERPRESAGGPVVLYAGAERLDAQRCTRGEPPLIDGAVLSLGAPAESEPHPEMDDAPAQLHVVAGPDAGGVHLLHGGPVNIGRSADADVPLDDPDVSRLHCAVTLDPDGRVSVADLGSTNGTALDGTRVHARPVRFTPGALLRIGESALRLAPAGGPGARVATTPDGEGHVRVACGTGGESFAGDGQDRAGHRAAAPDASRTGRSAVPAQAQGAPGTAAGADTAETGTGHAYGSVSWGASGTAPGARAHGPVEPPAVPVQGGAPLIESHGAVPGGGPAHGTGDGGDTHGGRTGPDGYGTTDPGASGTDRSSTGLSGTDRFGGGTADAL
ncbi:FHA domain-containing protein, partial [Streptomyces sp. NPDC059766]|uniref:FHA domain-containing protein n=1 Tax=Streptomyces sp. NPDC059766 TaxID=3346940 RepID=UPI003653FC93